MTTLTKNKMDLLGVSTGGKKVLLVFPNKETVQAYGSQINQMPNLLLSWVKQLPEVLNKYQEHPDIRLIAIGGYPEAEQMTLARKLRANGFFQFILLGSESAEEKDGLIDGLFRSPAEFERRVKDLL